MKAKHDNVDFVMKRKREEMNSLKKLIHFYKIVSPKFFDKAKNFFTLFYLINIFLSFIQSYKF